MNKHVVRQHVLPEDLEKRLERVAARTNKSTVDELEIAVARFLDEVETEDEWLAELDDRMREMDNTGLHVTHDEAMEWLERLAKGEDVPPPKAHT